MKFIVVIFSLASGLATASLAGNPAVLEPSDIEPIADNIIDWSGMYAGVTLGTAQSPFEGVFDNGDGESDQIHFSDFENSGLSYGVQVGYDLQSGNMVYGVVADYGLTSISGEGLGEPDGNMAGAGIASISSLRARAGLAQNNSLIYVTAGASWVDIDAYIQDDGDEALDVGGKFDGTTYGVGLENMMSGGMSWGVELLHHQVDYLIDLYATGHPDTDPGDFISLDGVTTIQLTAKYRF